MGYEQNMALHPGLTTTGFWNQEAQMQSAGAPRSFAPSASRDAASGYGMTSDNLCLPCATRGLDSLCSTQSRTGGTNPIVPCEKGELYQCRYQTLDQCYGNATKAGLVAGMSRQPYSKVMETAFHQPSYGTAFQTMAAGKL